MGRKRLIVVAAWYPAAHHPVARPVLALITDVGAVGALRLVEDRFAAHLSGEELSRRRR